MKRPAGYEMALAALVDEQIWPIWRRRQQARAALAMARKDDAPPWLIELWRGREVEETEALGWRLYLRRAARKRARDASAT